jgi:hypothetical protein
MSSINQFKYYHFSRCDRADWPSLFGEAQNYWKEYEDKNDEDLQKKVRFSAYYNLATIIYS